VIVVRTNLVLIAILASVPLLLVIVIAWIFWR